MRISIDYTKGKPHAHYSTNIDEDKILHLYLSEIRKEKIQKKLNIPRSPIYCILKRERVRMRTIIDYQKKKK